MPRAQLAMARPIIHHRTSEFKDLLIETRKNLQKIFKTESEILILASSGTGAMEAAVSALISAEEKALAVVVGKFGERWVEICAAFGITCNSLTKPYGEAASADEIVQALREQPDTRALLIQGCETSTATSHDLEAIAGRVRNEFPDLLIIVDAITALGSQPVETDAWGLDVVISGSQKSFAIPPGLACLSLSRRALQRLGERKKIPSYYLDLRKELKNQPKGQTAYTPAISLVVALNEACLEMLEQGIDPIVAEAQLMARATQRGLQALGFRLLSSAPSGAATAAYPPEGIDAGELTKQVERKFGVKLAGGQGELKGKIIRIAHLGYFDLLDVAAVLWAIELSLLELGAGAKLGTGVSAALEEAGQEIATHSAV